MESAFDEKLFKAVAWFVVKDGQKVYLKGKQWGAFRAYGPYTVKQQSRRMLVNNKGNAFMHYAEELLLKRT